MTTPAAFPLTAAQSGVYAAPAALAELEAAARAAGLAWFELDLTGVRGQAALMAHCRQVFGLPPLFGDNWDALADSLGDFSWVPARGYVAVLRNGAAFTRGSPHEFATLLSILVATAMYWAGKQKVFAALLDDDTRRALNLQALPYS